MLARMNESWPTSVNAAARCGHAVSRSQSIPAWATSVLDPLGLLGHFPFPLGEFAAQPFNLLLQPFLGVPPAWLRCRAPHASDGTPIA